MGRADTSPILSGDPNISPWAVGRYHGWYEISRLVTGVDGFGKEDLTVARAGVREGTLLAEEGER